MNINYTANTIFLIAGLLSAHSSAVDIDFSGYGSIIAGKVLDGDVDTARGDEAEFTADFYDVGIYGEDIEFKPESIFAIQARMQLMDKAKVTAQLVAKGVDDFEPELDWFYLTYQLTPSWTIHFGRRNIPMYYFSEYMEVGFAYPWMRPPANLYWWQITQFNGITASYNSFFADGDYTSTLSFFYGNENDEDNRLLDFYNDIGFYGGPGSSVSVDEDWKDITGFNWHIAHDAFEVRFSYFVNDLEREIFYNNNVPGNPLYNASFPESGSTSFERTQTFIGLGGQLNFDNLTVYFDMNYVTRDEFPERTYPTYLVSAVYSFGKIKPFISYSKADQDDKEAEELPNSDTDDREEHQIVSIGLRYDISPKLAFKIQHDSWKDQGAEVGGWNYHGDAKLLTAGFDFIF